MFPAFWPTVSFAAVFSCHGCGPSLESSVKPIPITAWSWNGKDPIAQESGLKLTFTLEDRGDHVEAHLFLQNLGKKPVGVVPLSGMFLSFESDTSQNGDLFDHRLGVARTFEPSELTKLYPMNALSTAITIDKKFVNSYRGRARCVLLGGTQSSKDNFGKSKVTSNWITYNFAES